MTQQPIGTLLARSAAEARAMARAAERLDAAIADLAHTAAVPNDFRRWQEADLLRQSLQELAQFLERLADVIPPDCMVDPSEAARQLRLRDLARRLVSPPDEITDDAAAFAAVVTAADGDVQLF